MTLEEFNSQRGVNRAHKVVQDSHGSLGPTGKFTAHREVQGSFGSSSPTQEFFSQESMVLAGLDSMFFRVSGEYRLYRGVFFYSKVQ